MYLSNLLLGKVQLTMQSHRILFLAVHGCVACKVLHLERKLAGPCSAVHHGSFVARYRYDTSDHRYTAEYPHQQPVLKVQSTQGLTGADTRALVKLLNASSAEYAKQGNIAGFSLADAAQEFLLSKNTPEAAKVSFKSLVAAGNLLQSTFKVSSIHAG